MPKGPPRAPRKHTPSACRRTQSDYGSVPCCGWCGNAHRRRAQRCDHGQSPPGLCGRTLGTGRKLLASLESAGMSWLPCHWWRWAGRCLQGVGERDQLVHQPLSTAQPDVVFPELYACQGRSGHAVKPRRMLPWDAEVAGDGWGRRQVLWPGHKCFTGYPQVWLGMPFLCCLPSSLLWWTSGPMSQGPVSNRPLPRPCSSASCSAPPSGFGLEGLHFCLLCATAPHLTHCICRRPAVSFYVKSMGPGARWSGLRTCVTLRISLATLCLSTHGSEDGTYLMKLLKINSLHTSRLIRTVHCSNKHYKT